MKGLANNTCRRRAVTPTTRAPDFFRSKIRYLWDATAVELEVSGERRNRRHFRRRQLLLQLQAAERGIAPPLAKQFVMAPGFDDLAGLDHQDAIGMHDG